ncbi:sensor histidine kinase [Marinobacter oulmenensis]|uniref:histidine kinase n=1 Tax=Marinobacter oulmenensis TaxID=643747 RepID=A0A840U5Z5_9GAMM|nr:ATP-binding protein [Marinobacter oulmenensis]MBB5319633.1 signal transduction histidine kinase [Marinobacter oulmenensis]
MKNLSLGTRFAAIAIISTAITVSILSVTAYRELVSDFEQALTLRQQVETTNYASRVSLRLQLRLDALGVLASRLSDGQRLLPAKELEAILKRQTTLADYFDLGLVVMDDKAVAVAENRHVPGRIGTSYADRSHFQEMLDSGQPHISRPIIGRTTGVMLISFLQPVRNNQGELVGLLTGALPVDRDTLLPQPQERTPGERFMVLDTQYFTRVDAITRDNRLPFLPNPGESPLIDAALSGMTTGVVEDSGQRWIYATRHLERVGWEFLRAVPYEQATQPARDAFFNFILFSLIVVVITAVLVAVMSRLLTHRLETIARRIQNMTKDRDASGRLAEKGPPELRSVAKAFNQLMDDREALDKLKNQFVSNVSHELRTPLTSINGSLKLLASGAVGPLPEKAERMVNVALRNSDQLQRLISDLLDFNKTIAGQMVVHTEPLHLPTLIEEAAIANRPYAQSHRVQLEASRIPEAHVLADPHRVRQILDNYISNACKFSPEQGRITLSASIREAKTVRILVADQGKGVPDEFRPYLFERFSQAETGSAKARAGTGLGLAICRELAKLMGGRVGYFYDNGSHFWVDLPIATDQEDGGNDETG